uniref:Solute carrier family 13 member 5-like n=1 Tax=Saccoglossus kowalevskii TaxID=10224 RepID=A0ABM0MM70_SACKO|nr:PREDICTED: solute carrier family 13 member 5-like [Saccoglossus kowalevskii]
MSFYWVFECMPIAVTSLIPLALFPVFGIMDGGATASMYFKDTSALLLGGIMMAIAIEHWNLHRRIALSVLMISGTKKRWLLLSFMLVTWFLSAWMSNTATTAMMLPIAQAVLVRLSEINTLPKEEYTKESHHIEMGDVYDDATGTEYIVKNDTEQQNGSSNTLQDNTSNVLILEEKAPDAEIKIEDDSNGLQLSEDYRLFGKALMLAICYAANVGGTATLIGTSPQLILLSNLDERFDDHPLNFLSWFIFSFPSSFLFIFIAWFWLLFMYLDLCPWRKSGLASCSCSCKTTEEEILIKKVIRDDFKNLGPFSWAELCVLTLFVTLCVAWITRDIGGYGWTNLFPEDYVTDATPAIFMAIVLFCFPCAFPSFFGFRTKEDTSKTAPKVSLLNWKVVNEKMPWGLYLLLGGGFALAEGMEVSGLSQWIGDQLSSLGSLEDWVIVLVCSTLVCFFTEVTSNTAVATIFIPIIGALAGSICLHPLYVLMPCAILISYAFMLPVATAPNAMVFANGLLTIPDMAITGLGLNILGILWINFWVNSYGRALFDLDEYPDWAKTDNTTCADTTVNVTLI